MQARQGLGLMFVVAIIALLAAAAAWGMRPTFHALHANWTGAFGHFSHGYLVLAMAGWLGWRSWRSKPFFPGSPGWLALPLLALTALVAVAAEIVSFETASQSLLPVLAIFAVAAAFGWHTAHRLMWPIAFLYTALPIWWYLNTPLQELTSFVVNKLVKLSGVPAFVEGNVFYLPAGILEVAAGCSGLRFLDTAVALSLFQGLLFLTSWRDRFKLIALACALALFANWVRVYSLMVIAYASDMQHYLVRVEHLYYGWAIFLLCMWPVFWYGARLEHRAAPQPAVAPRIPHAQHPTAFRPVASVVAGALAAASLAAPHYAHTTLEEASQSRSQLPLLSTAQPRSNSWILGNETLLRDSEEERATFQMDGQPMFIYRATSQASTRLTDWPVDGLQLMRQEWSVRDGAFNSAGRIGNVEFVQRYGSVRDTEVLARTGTTIGGLPADTKLAQKLAILRGLFKLRRDSMTWIAVTPCKPDCREGARRLDEWMQMNVALLGGG